ncbi:MAG: hypothetical protein QME81_00490, partial [bacterium]|nr:hypothetical protein [bacterium]
METESQVVTKENLKEFEAGVKKNLEGMELRLRNYVYDQGIRWGKQAFNVETAALQTSMLRESQLLEMRLKDWAEEKFLTKDEFGEFKDVYFSNADFLVGNVAILMNENKVAALQHRRMQEQVDGIQTQMEQASGERAAIREQIGGMQEQIGGMQEQIGGMQEQIG